MKILIFNGSPRKQGNTVHLIEAFMMRAIELGNETVRYDLDRMFIKPCKACDACANNKGRCVLKDDFNAIYEDILEADGILFAAPLYWYSLPAQLKILIDRLYCLQGMNFKTGSKKVGIIGACADSTEDSFQGFLYGLEKSIEYLGWENVGKVLATGVWGPNDVLKTAKPKEAADLAEKFT